VQTSPAQHGEPGKPQLGMQVPPVHVSPALQASPEGQHCAKAIPHGGCAVDPRGYSREAAIATQAVTTIRASRIIAAWPVFHGQATAAT
jgi:hypothetical protein